VETLGTPADHGRSHHTDNQLTDHKITQGPGPRIQA
jgi:hypothetical protein